MTDCNCPKCQALPTKHRLAAERDQLAAALEDLLEVENDQLLRQRTRGAECRLSSAGSAGSTSDSRADAGGFRTDWFCEQDEFCQPSSPKHWPGVPRYPDITASDVAETSSPSTSSAAASPAKTQRRRNAAPASPELARVFGQSTPVSLASFDPTTSSWRTSQLSLLEDSAPFSETWPRSGMTRNGTAFQLQPLAPLTAVTGSGLWPTPDTGAMARFGTWPDAEHRTKDGLWTTPAADDTGHRKARYAQGGSALSMQAGGRLNPEWVEWLMGFPIKWSDCTLLVTRSSRRSRSGSAGASSSTKPKENSVQPDAGPTKPKEKPDA
jgi:hypothetical protein